MTPPTNPMDLPPDLTCGDCAHFARKCSWFISSLTGKETRCDWSPSRFRMKPVVGGAPEEDDPPPDELVMSLREAAKRPGDWRMETLLPKAAHRIELLAMEARKADILLERERDITMTVAEWVAERDRIVDLGWALSTWAAGTNWDPEASESANTAEWLAGLKARIEAFQEAARHLVNKEDI